jgi:hypothetical protein
MLAAMTTVKEPASRWRRVARRLAVNACIFYLLAVLVFYSFQTTLIFPGSWKQGTAGAQITQPPAGAELIELKSPDGQPIKALFAAALHPDGTPRTDAAARPTILYFYGNGMALSDTLGQIADMRRLGANVMAADYLGYGMSGGKAGEQACYDTATAEYQWLIHDPRVAADKIIVAGWSLGAAVAVDLAAHEKVAGLMMFSAFTSLADVATGHYPWLLIRPLLKHRFASIDKLPQVHCPVLLAHGQLDTLVPYDMMRRLESAAGGPVEVVDVPGADHNGFWDIGRPLVLPAIGRMVEKAAGRENGS